MNLAVPLIALICPVIAGCVTQDDASFRIGRAEARRLSIKHKQWVAEKARIIDFMGDDKVGGLSRSARQAGYKEGVASGAWVMLTLTDKQGLLFRTDATPAAEHSRELEGIGISTEPTSSRDVLLYRANSSNQKNSNGQAIYSEPR